MFKEHNILALIPARGGSKGIPRKNIKVLHGSPLIAYTIAAARNSRYIDDVVVTTDSDEIAKIARDYGASVPFMRPSELADDRSKTIDAVLHAVETLEDMGRTFDAVVLLQPTSPLRTSVDIDCSIETFYSHGSLGVASVSEAIGLTPRAYCIPFCLPAAPSAGRICRSSTMLTAPSTSIKWRLLRARQALTTTQ